MKIYAVCPNCGCIDFNRTGDGFNCIGCGEYVEIEELSLCTEEDVIPSLKVDKINTNNCHNNATDIEIEKLWDELEDVPIDENECLDIDWHGWSKGTHREEIWHWFDEHHSKGVGWLMNERETTY